MNEKTVCPIAAKVSNMVLSRAAVGLKKYGVTADRDDLSVRQWIQHAQEELLDASVYLEKLKKEVAPEGGAVRCPGGFGLSINPSMRNLEAELVKAAEEVGYKVGAVFEIKFSKWGVPQACKVVRVLGPSCYKVVTAGGDFLDFDPARHQHKLIK